MSQEKKSTLGWFMFLFENYGLLLGFIFYVCSYRLLLLIFLLWKIY
jgi:hypothetical protein